MIVLIKNFKEICDWRNYLEHAEKIYKLNISAQILTPNTNKQSKTGFLKTDDIEKKDLFMFEIFTLDNKSNFDIFNSYKILDSLTSIYIIFEIIKNLIIKKHS